MPEEEKVWESPIIKETFLPFSEFDLSKQEGFILTPFNKEEDFVLFEIGEKEPQELVVIQEKLFQDIVYPEFIKDKYISLVKKAVKEIKKSDLEKVVLATKIVLKQKVDPRALFNKMCNTYPHAFLYCIEKGHECWIGASPEMLARFKQGKGKTVALAGTQDKKKKKWGDKEKEEQNFIQSYIIDKMKGIDDVLFERGDTRTISAGQIEHISSLFNFETNINGLSQLVKELHPTPAVCGYPESKSKDFIRKNEDLERSYYAGFLGFNDPNSTDLFVNLRCAKLNNSSCELFAGAGITIDSNPEKEWEEVCKKMNTLSVM